MKTKRTLLTLSILLLTVSMGWSQTFSTAVEYMNFIGEQHQQLAEDQWDYTSAVANDKKAKKIDSKRTELLTSNKVAQAKVKKMPEFDGKGEYRDSVVAYLELNYNVLNEDYAKIVDMEEIAEQSYDLMEAYLLAQDMASQRLKEAGEMLTRIEKKFAKDNNITLLEGKSKTGERLTKANKVYKYYNEVYLIFFKAYKQDAYLNAAFATGDVSAMEQNKNSMIEYAEEGLEKLEGIKIFDGDNSLKEACADILNHYLTSAKGDYQSMIDFYVDKENFESINKAFEAKKKKDRTQKDAEEYNNAVNKYNKSTEQFNKSSEGLNKAGSKKITTWNNTSTKFTKKHV
jgi:hypothetical protein